MDAWLHALLDAELPLPWWLALALWVALYALTFAVGARSRAALRAQSHLVLAHADVLAHEQRRGPQALAFVLLTALLLVAYPMGEPYTSLIAGGLLGAFAMLLGIALHGLKFATSLARPGVEGTMTLSPAFVLANVGHDMLGSAAACLASGFAFASMPLLGAALLLGAMGLSHVDRARKVAP
jgi:hypothetical protein